MSRRMRDDPMRVRDAKPVERVGGTDERHAGSRSRCGRRGFVATSRLAFGLAAVVLVSLSSPVSASARLRLPRLFAGSGIVTELPTVNVPTVKAQLQAKTVHESIDNSEKLPLQHSRAFNEFMQKFAKNEVYCPNQAPPCEESTIREQIFLNNLVEIEAHNEARQKDGGGMRLGVTRFADLTPEEFQNHHGAKNVGADEALRGAGDVLGMSVHGNGLVAPRDLNEHEHRVKTDVTYVSKGDAPLRTTNGVGGVTTRVAKLGAGGPVSGVARTNGNAGASESLLVDGGRVFDCANTVSRAVQNAAKTRFATSKPHSIPFTEFVDRFGKRTSYCGNDPHNFPCEESYRREILLLRNIRHVETHNAKRTSGGMKKIVTRFADLTENEFAANHATYDARGAVGGKQTAGGSPDQGKTSESEDLGSIPAGDALSDISVSLPRKALVAARREARYASRRAAAADARLGRATGLASLGDAEDAEDDELLASQKELAANQNDQEDDREATLGLVAAEAALLAEEEDLANQAAAAFELESRREDETAKVTLMDLSNRDADSEAADAVKQSVLDYASALGTMQTVLPRDFDLPDVFDWRSKMDIGPLYSQGACSGCWAYSTVQVIADSKLIGTGHRPSPSPYYLLSCDELDSGCNTGNMATAYAWIQTQPRGLLSAEEYPTTGGECAAGLGEREDGQKQSPGVIIDGFCEIPPLRGEETIHAMLRALTQQPVAVGMNVKPLQLYGGGLVQMSDCPPASDDQISAINHAAVVVGWGVDDETGKPFWLVKNSYGQDWGENGYARLEMSFAKDSNYGVCGFFSEQNYPLTDGRDCAEGSNKKWSEKRGDDVYLMPDNVVVLPNGGGILTPARIKVFGHDLTSILKIASFACFALCVFFLAVEVFYCVVGSGGEDENGTAPATPASRVTTPLVSPEKGRNTYGSR